MHCLFVTPALDGPATGGTLYNRQLLAALAGLPDNARRGVTFEQASFDDLPRSSTHAAQQVWVDSLYLAELPGLRGGLPSSARVGLLLHYLPSLLSHPELHTAAELSEPERRALHAADMVITPSEYLRELVLGICPGKPCASVTPGVRDIEPRTRARDGSALMICNVTENKGVLPFLHELAHVAPPTAAFQLRIAGSLQLEPSYAQACLALCEQHTWLRAHVTFLGSVDPDDLLERLAHASVLVSASRMESYGMALAEARALGTPILALPGGNIAYHVAAESGGQLAHSPRELAQAVCALMADPDVLSARLSRARETATRRLWSTAASDFVAAALHGASDQNS
jgi:glycosyltransferase involved in cell wall biosynthesis